MKFFYLLALAVLMSGCVGTYKNPICESSTLVNIPIEGTFKQLEYSNGKYIPLKTVRISKIEGHTGMYNYEVIAGSGVNRVLKACTVASELIVEFKNYKGMVVDQHMTFARPIKTENGFGLVMTDFYTNEKGESVTLDNTGMSAYETLQQFSFRDRPEVLFAVKASN